MSQALLATASKSVMDEPERNLVNIYLLAEASEQGSLLAERARPL